MTSSAGASSDVHPRARRVAPRPEEPTGPRAPARESASSVTENYLKVIFSATEWGARPATVSSLAARFGCTRATVSATLRRLAAKQLLEHERYGQIILTPTGRNLAITMVRRHRLIETFLVRQLGYSWAEVHDEAERLEHAVSATFVDRIDTLLGRPTTDPHGDPIPTSDGSMRYPRDAVRLSQAPPGRYRVVRVSDEDAARLRHLAGVGLAPGAIVTVHLKPDAPDAPDAPGASGCGSGDTVRTVDTARSVDAVRTVDTVRTVELEVERGNNPARPHRLPVPEQRAVIVRPESG